MSDLFSAATCMHLWYQPRGVTLGAARATHDTTGRREAAEGSGRRVSREGNGHKSCTIKCKNLPKLRLAPLQHAPPPPEGANTKVQESGTKRIDSGTGLHTPMAPCAFHKL